MKADAWQCHFCSNNNKDTMTSFVDNIHFVDDIFQTQVAVIIECDLCGAIWYVNGFVYEVTYAQGFRIDTRQKYFEQRKEA